MRAIYSFNKTGFEERYWQRELAYSAGDDVIIPFNHGRYLDPSRIPRAQLLDNLYFNRDPSVIALYERLSSLMMETRADSVIVDNVMPYHPEFLRTLDAYKVLRTSDGPLAAYDRDFAYQHAYDHVVYHSPAYSPELSMPEKLRYVGAKRMDFWPLAAFDEMFRPDRTEDELFSQPRDIDIIFVGAVFPNKMPYLAKLKKAFGRKLLLRGLSSFRKNVFFNLKYGFPGWVSPIEFSEYVPLYQRAKIGINIHNRGDYTVGSYRLFDLPANVVMQISDGGDHLGAFFKEDEEIVRHGSVDDLIDKIRYYLDHPQERERIARNGYRRTMADHRIAKRLGELAAIVNAAMRARS